MLTHLFTPFDKDDLLARTHDNDWSFAHQCHIPINYEIDFKKFDIIVIFWRCTSYKSIIQSLCHLAAPSNIDKICLLGEVNDETIILSELLDLILQAGCFPLILSDDNDALSPILNALERKHDRIQVGIVDNTVEYSSAESTHFPLNILLKQKTSYIKNLVFLGLQNYYCSKESLDILDSLDFEHYRLGETQKDIELCEPYLRDQSLVSMNLRAIRSADHPSVKMKHPNGYFAQEFCKIVRYVAMNERLHCLHFCGFHLDPDKDHQQSAQLIAQLIWFTASGYESRLNEYPLKKDHIIEYIIDNQNISANLLFYKSKLSERWWFDLNSIHGGHTEKKLIACTKSDYDDTCQGDIPTRIWRLIKKENTNQS